LLAGAFARRADLAHQEVDRGLGHLLDGLANGGQLGPDGRGQGRVVEAGDGQVAGHVQAHAMGDGHRGGGHVVVGGEHRGGAGVLREQDLGGVEAGPIVEQALHDEAFVDGQARIRHRVPEAGQPTRAGGLVGMTDDESESLVAEAQQVARHHAGRLAVVDADGTEALVGLSAGDRDRGHAASRDHVDQRARIAEGRWQDQAVDAVGQQFLDDLPFVLVGLALLHHQLDVGQSGLVQQADQKLAQVAGGRVAVQDADARLLAACQVPRRLVRGVVQGGDGGIDQFARAGAHIGGAIDDARHRHGRDACHLGDVGDGGDPAPACVVHGFVSRSVRRVRSWRGDPCESMSFCQERLLRFDAHRDEGANCCMESASVW
jgi:hypothetical protein